VTSPGLTIGRYEVAERLGKGGFGVVHLARDRELGREVAIKFLKPEFLTRPELVQRFLQEARAAAKIGHPGIVTVFECGIVSGTGLRVDGTAYIVMERLHGESLADRIDDRGKLGATVAIAITRQLADALAAAHAAGIIHRDLKPDNVFLVPDPAVVGGERVKILDFGVAKLAEPSDVGIHTHSKMMLGTPRYMAPEQARSAARVDHRGDIYALGCMLYEMVCGRPPFTGDVGDVIIAHQSKPPAAPRSVDPTVSRELDALILEMLAKDPDARPATMSAVAAALPTAEPAVAPPAAPRRIADDDETFADASTLERPNRRVRPSPAAIAAILGVLVGVIALVMIGYCGGQPPVPPSRLDMTLDATVTMSVTLPVDAASPLDALECESYIQDRRWIELDECARTKLQKLDAVRAAALSARAKSESEAEVALRDLKVAIREGNSKLAHVEHGKTRGSLYEREADEVHAPFLVKTIDAVVARLEEKTDNCRDFDRLLISEEETRGAHVTDEAKLRVSCKTKQCDAAALTMQGRDAFQSGNFSAAITLLESSLACRFDQGVVPQLVLAACTAKNQAKAMRYYPKLSTAQQPSIVQRCLDNKIDPR
jgi:tRNA A-37 threonylcarbamoyl transferase component Bud32